jgi:hypothetical protein
MIARANAGQAGTDDENVEMFGYHDALRTGLDGGRIVTSSDAGLSPRIHHLRNTGRRVKPGIGDQYR